MVFAALAVVTLVTWRLLIRETDERMDLTLDAEVFEFRQIVGSGNDPETGSRSPPWPMCSRRSSPTTSRARVTGRPCSAGMTAR